MKMEFAKESVDVGIVVADRRAALAFYRDILGFRLEHEVPLVDGGVLYRLACGTSIFKIMAPGTAVSRPPRSVVEPVEDSKGLVRRCLERTGIRYITVTISNIDAVYRSCTEGDCGVVFPLNFARPGTKVAVVEDPDGNWIELVEYADPEAAMADRERKSVRQG